jgi:hypothetical protein
MKHRASAFLAAAFLLLAPVASQASLSSYAQNFETLGMADPAALSADGWVVYGNVYTSGGAYIYGYGTFPAPNGASAFCSIDAGQGGIDQGMQQLSVYSDYNNTDHGIGRLIESNTFREQTIGAGDVGNTWTFQFDAKHGNLVAPSTAIAFIKTINPAAGYATTNFISLKTDTLPATWGTFFLSITIDAGLVGQILQTGFSNTATGYVSSGIYYDNLYWTQTATGSVGEPGVARTLELAPAAPNPFRGATRLDFSLPARGPVDISVFDVSGRRVANLLHADADAGPHVATWDGRDADGRLAPAGVYRAVLTTASGQVARGLVLTH